jgi:hypothetical protein
MFKDNDWGYCLIDTDTSLVCVRTGDLTLGSSFKMRDGDMPNRFGS